MKTRLLLTILSITFTSIITGQPEALNQYDDKGKKHGKWEVNLDKDWKKVDSSEVLFKRYTYFEHGKDIYPMGSWGCKNCRLEVIPKEAMADKLLDGEYKWFDKKGRLSSVHVLKNGKYISFKEYHPSGSLDQFFDYTKKCEGQEHGWTAYIYDKKGEVSREYVFCIIENVEP